MATFLIVREIASGKVIQRTRTSGRKRCWVAEVSAYARMYYPPERYTITEEENL